MKETKLLLGENLRRARFLRNWSQTFVANQIGISQRTLSRAETGCGISKHTLKKLCGLYQLPVSQMYTECNEDEVKDIQILPEDTIVGLMARNGFLRDMEREVVLQFTAVLQKEALLLRDDVDVIIAEAVAEKKSYTAADLVTVAMAVNQHTLTRARQLIVA